MTEEGRRLEEAREARIPWRKWGPYLAERQWGTVRRDLILFYEYFHGDNGTGLGASHQTGWTGLVAGLIRIFGNLDAETLLESWGREPLRDRAPAATAANR